MSQTFSKSRRKFVQASVAVAGSLVLPPVWGKDKADLPQLLQQSDLVYITPIKSDGEESRCQAEIWFVYFGDDIYVCTDTDSWRAAAPSKGLEQARIWVGDVGVWTSSDGRYKELPQLETTADIIKDAEVHKQALESFGKKYPVGWLRWGSAFKDGLADGTRSLIRYRPNKPVA
ncbi:MAG: hypothetical protein AAF512_10725 [Pseudomonadota bacterium]